MLLLTGYLHYEENTIIIPISHTRKLKHSKITYLPKVTQ